MKFKTFYHGAGISSKRHLVLWIKVSTLDNNNVFINLCFLQKVNCQKTVWDQARFSCLLKWFVIFLYLCGLGVTVLGDSASTHGDLLIITDLCFSLKKTLKLWICFFFGIFISFYFKPFSFDHLEWTQLLIKKKFPVGVLRYGVGLKKANRQYKSLFWQ